MVWVLGSVIGLAVLCLAGWVTRTMWNEEHHRYAQASPRPDVPARPLPGGGPEVERTAVMRRAVEVKRQQDAAALEAALAMLAVSRSVRDDQP